MRAFLATYQDVSDVSGVGLCRVYSYHPLFEKEKYIRLIKENPTQPDTRTLEISVLAFITKEQTEK